MKLFQLLAEFINSVEITGCVVVILYTNYTVTAVLLPYDVAFLLQVAVEYKY